MLFSFPTGDESCSDSNSNDEADDEGFDENSIDPKLLKKLKQVSITFIQGIILDLIFCMNRQLFLQILLWFCGCKLSILFYRGLFCVCENHNH